MVKILHMVFGAVPQLAFVHQFLALPHTKNASGIRMSSLRTGEQARVFLRVRFCILLQEKVHEPVLICY